MNSYCLPWCLFYHPHIQLWFFLFYNSAAALNTGFRWFHWQHMLSGTVCAERYSSPFPFLVFHRSWCPVPVEMRLEEKIRRLGFLTSAFWFKKKKKIFAILTHYKSRSVDKLGGVSTLEILVAFYSWNWLIRIIACYVCVWVCVCMYVYFSGGFLFFLNYSWHTIEPLYFRIGQDLRDNILNILEQQSLDRFLLSQEFPEVPGEREKLRIQGSWFPLLLNQSISILTVLCIGVSHRFFFLKKRFLYYKK